MKLKGVKLENLDEVAQAVIDSLGDSKTAKIIHLHGDLGAGKTTLVKSIARVLGITGQVQSPTFVFMREYDSTHKSFKKLYHIDAYRFDNKEEGDILGLDNIKNKNNLIVIEWPEKMNAGEPDITLHLKHKTETTRDIDVTHHIKTETKSIKKNVKQK